MKGVFFIFFSLLLMGYLCMMQLPWDVNRHHAIAEIAIGRRTGFEIYRYPICYFPEMYEQKIPIFAYGSLLSRNSAISTINPETYDQGEPAIAFGVKKIFNRHMPQSQYGNNLRNHTAMLNLAFHDDYREFTPGVIFYVNKKELCLLAAREKGYDLIPLPVVSWSNLLDNNEEPNVEIAYAFVATQEKYREKKILRNDIMPVPAYAQVTINGAKSFGDSFFQLWLATTVLADGNSSFCEWAKSEGLLSIIGE